MKLPSYAAFTATVLTAINAVAAAPPIKDPKDPSNSWQYNIDTSHCSALGKIVACCEMSWDSDVKCEKSRYPHIDCQRQYIDTIVPDARWGPFCCDGKPDDSNRKLS